MESDITMAGFKAAARARPGPWARRFEPMWPSKDAAAIETLSADRDYVGQLRTTCVATMITGGHATTPCRRRPQPR